MIILNKDRHVSLIIILFGIFWASTASKLSLPFLTLYLHNYTNISIISIGIIVGCQPLALCFGSTIGGYLSDKFSRQAILISSLIMSIIAYLGFYLTSNYINNNYIAIIFATLNLINGIATALFSPISRVILSDLATSPEDKIKLFHTRYLIWNIGSTVGPLLGAYLGLSANNLTFLITGTAYIIYASLIIILPYKSPYSNSVNKSSYKLFQTIAILAKNKSLVSLLISLILFNIIYSQFGSNIAIIIENNIENGVVFFSYLLSLSAAIIIVMQPIIFTIVRNKNQSSVMIVGYIICLIGIILMLSVKIDKSTMIIFICLLTISEILIFPTGNIIADNITEEKYRGITYGIIDLEYFGSAIGPILGAFILQNISTNYYWTFMFIINILSIYFCKSIMVKNNK
ncbi:MAG: MFS transporter [Burkholderiales bacterium]|nr:MFS transporter [Burkholderiales bacterium]